MILISGEVQFVSIRFANELLKKKKRNALVDYLEDLEIYRKKKKIKSKILIL